MPTTKRTTVPQVLPPEASERVQAVKRKLVAAVYKQVIDAAEQDGFERPFVEEVLLLCGGHQPEVVRMWKLFQRTPEQQASDTFNPADFVAFIKEQQAKPRRRRRSKKR